VGKGKELSSTRAGFGLALKSSPGQALQLISLDQQRRGKKLFYSIGTRFVSLSASSHTGPTLPPSLATLHSVKRHLNQVKGLYLQSFERFVCKTFHNIALLKRLLDTQLNDIQLHYKNPMEQQHIFCILMVYRGGHRKGVTLYNMT
jgi:hypothetical protein